MTAFVLFRVHSGDLETLSALLAEQPGFLGSEELPAPDANAFPVDPAFRILEYGSETARQYAAWIAADGYRQGAPIWLRVYLEVDDETGLTTWLAAWPGAPGLIVGSGLVPPQDYVATSRARHTGQNIGQRLWVGPPWATPPPRRLPVIIDPGMAFGTGEHPTTRLCLELLEQAVSEFSGAASVPKPLRVLDVGTGSGILAIAAAKLLPGCELWTTDLDAQCATNAERNFELNGLQATPRHAFWGAAAEFTRVPAPSGGFDLVLTNIYSEVLRALVDPVAARLRPGGHWIVSGVLAGEQEQLFHETWNNRLECVRRRSLTQSHPQLSPDQGLTAADWEWVALHLHRAAATASLEGRSLAL